MTENVAKRDKGRRDWMAGQDLIRVRAAVVEKDGKIDYLYEQGDIDYYVEVLGWRIIDWEDMYI